MSIKVAVIQWSEARPPTKGVCSYDHVTANTPFGDFRITWKSWKDYPSYDLDIHPFGDTYFVSASTLDEVREAAQAEFARRVLLCLDVVVATSASQG